MLKWLSHYAAGKSVCNKRKKRYDLRQASRDSMKRSTTFSHESVLVPDLESTPQRYTDFSCDSELLSTCRSRDEFSSARTLRPSTISVQPRQLSPAAESRLRSQSGHEEESDEFLIVCGAERLERTQNQTGGGLHCERDSRHNDRLCGSLPEDIQQHQLEQPYIPNIPVRDSTDTTDNASGRNGMMSSILQRLKHRVKSESLDNFITPLKRRSISADTGVGSVEDGKHRSRRDQYARVLFAESSPTVVTVKASKPSVSDSQTAVIRENEGVTLIQVPAPRRCQSEGAMVDDDSRHYIPPPSRSVSTCMAYNSHELEKKRRMAQEESSVGSNLPNSISGRLSVRHSMPRVITNGSLARIQRGVSTTGRAIFPEGNKRTVLSGSMSVQRVGIRTSGRGVGLRRSASLLSSTNLNNTEGSVKRLTFVPPTAEQTQLQSSTFIAQTVNNPTTAATLPRTNQKCNSSRITAVNIGTQTSPPPQPLPCRSEQCSTTSHLADLHVPVAGRDDGAIGTWRCPGVCHNTGAAQCVGDRLSSLSDHYVSSWLGKCAISCESDKNACENRENGRLLPRSACFVSRTQIDHIKSASSDSLQANRIASYPICQSKSSDTLNQRVVRHGSGDWGATVSLPMSRHALLSRGKHSSHEANEANTASGHNTGATEIEEEVKSRRLINCPDGDEVSLAQNNSYPGRASEGSCSGFSSETLRNNAALFVARTCVNAPLSLVNVSTDTCSSPRAEKSASTAGDVKQMSNIVDCRQRCSTVASASVDGRATGPVNLSCSGLREKPWTAFSWLLDDSALAPHTETGEIYLTAELVQHLSQCSHAEFDSCVEHFSIRALTVLISRLQQAILDEQQTRSDLKKRLHTPYGERSKEEAALHVCERRLSLLCNRSLRLLALHAMRSAEISGECAASFRDSLSFFQRAAELSASPVDQLCPSRGVRRSSIGSDDSSSVQSTDSCRDGQQVASHPLMTSHTCADVVAAPTLAQSSTKRAADNTVSSYTHTDRSDSDRSLQAILEQPVEPLLRQPQQRRSDLNLGHNQVTRTLSQSCLADRSFQRSSGSALRRAPSVDEILASVKTLCARRNDPQAMVAGRGGEVSLLARWNSAAAAKNSRHQQPPAPQPPLYDTPPVRSASVEAIYDQPASSRGQLESEEQPTYINAQTAVVRTELGPSVEYDVPHTASHVYDSPQSLICATYDTPRILVPNRSGSSSRVVDEECDNDSLESSSPPQPTIPTPDYVGDFDRDHGLVDFSSDDLDEGLGESSDGRSYYNEEAGLEVIMEEPEEEEEYGSSTDEEHSGLSPPRGRTFLGSLQESEGIGSAAEGDCSSPSSVTSSSGIHSTEGSPTNCSDREGDEKVQKDRCVEVYPETMRQRKQNRKTRSVDIKQWRAASVAVSSSRDLPDHTGTSHETESVLPSVQALKSQFEVSGPAGSKSGRSTKNRAPPAPKNPATAKEAPVVSSARRVTEAEVASDSGQSVLREHVPAIYSQFTTIDRRLMRPALSTRKWSPMALVDRLYQLPEPSCKSQGHEKEYVNMEGWLEKLPCGRKKATFWNAWKRRYFKACNGSLRYYQNASCETASLTLQLMGGNVEVSDNCVIGVDDGKGHHVVVRCSSQEDTERWGRALRSQTVEDFDATYVRPISIPVIPASFRRCIVIDIGSSSVRAGILHPQPTLPQLFMPAALVAPSGPLAGGAGRDVRHTPVCGRAALHADARAAGPLSFPLRPGSRVSKYSVDMSALQLLIQTVFSELRVTDASNYDVQVCLPRSFNTSTLAAILALLFDQFGARGVNLTHQSILAMWSYNATSGVVVDIGDRMDVVPVIDGYIVQSGVSRVPYGGVRIVDHLRQFLLQKRYSFSSEVESLLVRLVMENLCYVAKDYNHELQRLQATPEAIEKAISVKEYVGDCAPWRRIELDSGRFQATEGLFTPEAWDMDTQGVHKLVHKAIQECGIDGRREMARSIYLAGGVTLLPGFAERLQLEMDRLTPASITPKVHASPYRYHAAYLGACVLAASDGFQQAKVSRDSWLKLGASALNKWTG